MPGSDDLGADCGYPTFRYYVVGGYLVINYLRATCDKGTVASGIWALNNCVSDRFLCHRQKLLTRPLGIKIHYK